MARGKKSDSGATRPHEGRSAKKREATRAQTPVPRRVPAGGPTEGAAVRAHAEPDRWDPLTADDLDRLAFEALARRILAGGLTWVQVDARWPATRDALAGCDPGVVAALDDDALRHVMLRPDVLRNAARLRSVVDNARAFQEIAAEHGTVHAWLASLRSLTWEDRVTALSDRLRGVRERRAWRFLREIGEPVPDAPPWLDDTELATHVDPPRPPAHPSPPAHPAPGSPSRPPRGPTPEPRRKRVRGKWSAE